jgi:HD-GYP domain-containing protein (c-di-GMP phosphodiesterase class II)
MTKLSESALFPPLSTFLEYKMSKQIKGEPMLKQVKTEDLKIGMYVILPYSWFKKLFKPFHFRIDSQAQIDEINHEGVDEIYIDLAKSNFHNGTAPLGKLVTNPTLLPKDYITNNPDLVPPEITQPEKSKPINSSIESWLSEKFDVVQFENVIFSPSIMDESKAKEIYKHTLLMVNQLMEKPTAKNIIEGKKHIFKLVDFILKEEDAASWLASITTHDYYTYTHSVNVGFLSIMLAKELFKKSSSHNLHELGAGFFLHDIGKTQIAKSIINSPNKLSQNDLKIMRQHPLLGFKILQNAHQLTDECKYIVLQHHERADGKGYPFGLSGDQINIYARICSLADIYDALTAQRSYKIGHTPFDSLKIMKEEMYTHFDKELFDKFVLLFK